VKVKIGKRPLGILYRQDILLDTYTFLTELIANGAMTCLKDQLHVLLVCE
jgi:hypothetical protein